MGQGAATAMNNSVASACAALTYANFERMEEALGGFKGARVAKVLSILLGGVRGAGTANAIMRDSDVRDGDLLTESWRYWLFSTEEHIVTVTRGSRVVSREYRRYRICEPTAKMIFYAQALHKVYDPGYVEANANCKRRER